MYVTRPLSLYLKDQTALCLPPPEGPNSGFLVISDEEAEIRLGVRRGQRIRLLPFPQNRELSILESDSDIMFVPVLNQPLSANRYYVIRPNKDDDGVALTNNNKVISSCPFRPFDIYQQYEIIQKDRGHFQAKSIAPDGVVARTFLREEWKLYYFTPRQQLKEALGLNSSLRAQLPDLNVSLSNDCSQPVVVGKWYCPFMFVNEHGKKLKKPTKTLFYEMTLEQRWVRVFSKENSNPRENGVLVDVVVQTEAAKIAGIRDACWDEKKVATGVFWFTGYDGKKVEKIGLSVAIVERMKWEQERVGWVSGNQRIVRVKEFEGNSTWRKFYCYLLVETFVLKRKDGSLVLTYDYKHTHQIRCKWE